MIWFLYLCINGLSAFLDTIYNKNKKILSVSVFFIVLISLGMRYEIGVDWVVYESLFSGEEINVPFEPGYTLISHIFSITGMNFWVYVFCISALLLISLFYFFNKYSSFPVFCLGVYYILSFAFNIDFLRQIIAVAISLWAINFYIKRKFIIFLTLSLIAMSMHVSAAIILLVPLIDNSVFRKFAVLVLAFGIVLAMINQYPIEWIINSLSSVANNVYIEKIKLYTAAQNNSHIFTFNLIFKLVFLIVVASNKDKIYHVALNNKKADAIKLFISLFYLMMMIDIYLGKYGAIRLRLDEYLNPAFMVILSYTIMSCGKKIFRQLMVIFILSYSCSSYIKFTRDPYFINHFVYHNSIISQLADDKALDAERRNQVYNYWQEREKINIGD